MKDLYAIRICFLVSLCLCAGTFAEAQVRGELRLEVRDQQGAALAARGELISEANQFDRVFQVGVDGRYLAQDLPLGIYRLSVNAQGFAPFTDILVIRSEVPTRLALTLGIAPVRTELEVKDSATLLDPSRTGTQYAIGRQALNENVPVQPGRSLSDLVNDLPGWLYEANGVLTREAPNMTCSMWWTVCRLRRIVRRALRPRSMPMTLSPCGS